MSRCVLGSVLVHCVNKMARRATGLFVMMAGLWAPLSCGPKGAAAPGASSEAATAEPPKPVDIVEKFGTLPPTPEVFDVVVIDPGHGGHDWGAIGVEGIQEKDIVLRVSQSARDCLLKSRPGLKVFLTRDDDTFVPLADRSRIANNLNADVFVSVHANSARNTKARGIETYLMNPEASDREAHRVAMAENASLGIEGIDPNDPLLLTLWSLKSAQHILGSEDFGGVVHQTMAKEFNFKSRGVLQAPFFVLVRANMPAILMEVGFVTNEAEAAAFRDGVYLDRLGQGICRGILEYGSDFPRKLDFEGRKRVTGGDAKPRTTAPAPSPVRR